MSLESPRMVTAANHWAAFPTAVFSGSGIVEQKLHPTTPTSRQKQRQQQQQQANLPLMPKSEGLTGGQTKLLLPRNNGNRTVVGIAVDCHDNYCPITKDTSSLHSCTNAFIGGGANISTNAATGTTDLNLLKLAAASQQQKQQQQSSRMPLSSVMLPEMALTANSSNAALAAEQGATRARRSRAIAIKPSTNAKDDGEQPVSASAERQYDYATWKMFERITEFRRRYPIKRSYTHEASSSSARGAFYDHDEDETEAELEARDQVNDKGICTIGSRRSLMTPVNDVGQEHFFDGEVFELEL